METMGYETYQKDSYHITFGMIGGKENRYNSPGGHGKPSEPRRKKRKQHPPQGGTAHNTTTTNTNYNSDEDEDEDEDDDDEDDNHHSGQSQPLRQEVVFQPTTVGGAYATPYYPYQCPPPAPYPNQLAVGGYYHGDYHHHVPVPGYPIAPSFVPIQGGYYGNHGGGHMKEVGMVGAGAAIGVASLGMFKLLRERRRYGGRYN